MKIGVDLCALDPRYVGGVTSFALGLVRGLIETRDPGDTLVLIVRTGNSVFVREKLSGPGVEFLQVHTSRVGARINTTLFDISWATGAFKLRHWYDRIFRAGLMRRIDRAIDVLVAPTTLLEFYALRAPALLSIHDIQQEYHPEFFTWKQRVRRWAPYRLSAWKARQVQASSQYIKDCLLEKFSFMTPEKIVVMPEGVDIDAFSKTKDEKPQADLKPGDYIFYPAQLWPHKNHLMLVDALARYRDQRGTELTCVLTGGDYGHWPAIEARARARGLSRLLYLGRVNFEQLLWIYRNSLAVLALGMHESSSLPVREGAVFGKILICIDIPPNREAATILRIRLVDGTDLNDLADAFMALKTDRDAVVESSAQNAALAMHFDWRSIAHEYQRVVRSMVEVRG